MTIVIRSIFEENGKYYLQAFLDECMFECFPAIELIFQKKFTLIKQVHQKSVIIGILEILILNMNHMFVMVVMIYQWWLMN